MNEENNDHIPNKNPKPDPPMDEKRIVPPGMDDKGTPMAPSSLKRMRRAMWRPQAPLIAGFFPKQTLRRKS